MSAPVLNHRLQLLLDDERFERLRAQSEETGQSMGAIVRAAIDYAWVNPEDVADARRRAAARQILEMTKDRGKGPEKEPEWEEILAGIEEEKLRGFPE